MGHGFEDPSKRNRKRAVDHSEAVAKPPSAKRTAIAPEDNGSEHQERVRASVRALFDSYNALCSRSGTSVDSGAFQAMLKAAQGDIASQRLAARLVPRFIALFPDQVEVAAAALIKLYERYQDLEGFDKPLEEHTRKDALQGLQAVLLAASSNTPHGCQAVKLILSVLFKLLPQPDNEAATTEEPEEEEGEVAHHDSNAAAAAHGPWVRKVLRQALQQHPVTTLTFCFGCLGTSGRNSSSSSAVVPAMVQGVRLWLRDHILREASPSREGTPMDCDGGAAAAAAAAAAAGAGASAAGGGVGNGMQVPKAAAVVAAAAAAGGGAAGAHQRGCALQAVLESSAELRAWVRKESKGISRAPEDAKAVLQAAMQLMPPERAPSSKRLLGNQQQQQQQQRPGPPGSQAAGPSRLQQQQQQPPQFQQPSQQQQQPQHKAPNGVVPRPVNGMEALGRSWSTPSPGRGSRGRTASGRPPDPAAAGSLWAQFPHPAGPICRLEPCVLLSNLPRHITKADLQQQLQAVEAWILDQQPPAAAGAKSSGLRACCVMKAPLDAARAYMRHHKANRFGPQQPPVQVFFADGMPSCSRTANAAAAGGGSAAGGPSLFLWVLRAMAGDAEKVTDDLREAGLVPKSVSRVNHGSDPGTVLEAHSAKEAADMLAFLLKAHPAAAAAAAQQQQPSQEELPPLPPEPPPGTDWAPGSSNSSRGGSKLPSTPAGARQQQQQATPPVGGTPLQQQQQGFGPGFRRSNSMPVGGSGNTGISGQSKAAGEGGWRNSPAGAAAAQQGGWTPQGQQQQQQVQQPWAPGSISQQQQQPWQQGASPGQLGPGMDAGAAAGRPGWQHGTSPHHAQQQQQQQGRWPPSLTHPSAAAGGPPGAAAGAAALPPFPGPPGSQQQQLQRQHSLAGASPSGVGGGTPNHGGSPAGPVPSLAAGQGGGQQGTVHSALGGPTQQQYAGAQVLWRGGLYKSEVPVGTVCCVEPAGGARQSGAAPEPHQWPEALHINHRISVNDALEHYASAAPHARAVRLLLPQESPAGNVQAIRNFVQYLTTKGRAGMVKLPGAKGACGRALYLIVPRAQVCQSLQIAWDGRCVMLIVVIVPQSGTGGGGSSGGGAAGGKAALPGPPGSHGVQQHMGHRPMR